MFPPLLASGLFTFSFSLSRFRLVRCIFLFFLPFPPSFTESRGQKRVVPCFPRILGLFFALLSLSLSLSLSAIQNTSNNSVTAPIQRSLRSKRRRETEKTRFHRGCILSFAYLSFDTRASRSLNFSMLPCADSPCTFATSSHPSPRPFPMFFSRFNRDSDEESTAWNVDLYYGVDFPLARKLRVVASFRSATYGNNDVAFDALDPCQKFSLWLAIVTQTQSNDAAASWTVAKLQDVNLKLKKLLFVYFSKNHSNLYKLAATKFLRKIKSL